MNHLLYLLSEQPTTLRETVLPLFLTLKTPSSDQSSQLPSNILLPPIQANPLFFFLDQEFTMASLKRKQEWPSENSPSKKQKFDARNKFLLTENMKEKRKAALAKLQSLQAEPTSNFDVLPHECMLLILHHLELPKRLEDPETSSLWCFIRSMNRVNDLYNKHTRSILVGIQEQQYPQYLTTMFGKAGRQTEEQLQNLRCAIATQQLRSGRHDCDPETHWVLQRRSEAPQLHGLHFGIFLGHLSESVDHQLHQCRERGFGFVEWRHHLPTHSVKRALLTLWRMGWKKPDFHGQWAQGEEVQTKLDVAALISFFAQQPEEVRRCIRHLLLFVGKRVVIELGLEHDGKLWASAYCAEKVATPEEALGVVQWLRTTINATVLMATIMHGIDNAIEMHMSLHQRRIDGSFSVVSRMDELYELKPVVDNGGSGGPLFDELDGHVQFAKVLQPYDIFQDFAETPAPRRTDGLPFEGDL